MTRDALALVWHRRDLRLHDNAALDSAVQAYARVLAVFILDPEILARPDTAPARVQFMLESLAELQAHYARLGGQLAIRQGEPLATLQHLVRDSDAAAVYWNEDVEPYAIARDRQVREGLAADGIAVHTCQDLLMNSPAAIATQAGKPYSVFGPFWRNWIGQPKAEPLSRAPTPAGPRDRITAAAVSRRSGIELLAAAAGGRGGRSTGLSGSVLE